jgi:hypothetical protein
MAGYGAPAKSPGGTIALQAFYLKNGPWQAQDSGRRLRGVCPRFLVA